jgi:hypothetical protein
MERQNGKHIVGIGTRFRRSIRYLFHHDRERSFQARGQDQFFSAAALHHQVHPPVQTDDQTGNRKGWTAVLSLHHLRQLGFGMCHRRPHIEVTITPTSFFLRPSIDD